MLLLEQTSGAQQLSSADTPAQDSPGQEELDLWVGNEPRTTKLQLRIRLASLGSKCFVEGSWFVGVEVVQHHPDLLCLSASHPQNHGRRSVTARSGLQRPRGSGFGIDSRCSRLAGGIGGLVAHRAPLGHRGSNQVQLSARLNSALTWCTPLLLLPRSR